MITELEAMRMGVALAISLALALATPYLKAKFSPNSSLFDVWTTRICFILLAVGTVIVGLSTSLASMRTGKFLHFFQLQQLCNYPFNPSFNSIPF
jgi:ABC-type microcin C transport system permease subunit YejB